MSWTVRIGQADDGGGIRTQDRISEIHVSEEFAHKDFVVIITKPTDAERTQNKGRIDSALIEITRGSEDLIVGYIESVENSSDFVKYSGRSFLVLLGYSTSSETDDSGNTKAEYPDKTGAYIIDDLLDNFCYTKDSELTYTDITFTETYGGVVKLHGKKVYQIVKEMCSSYGKDLWSDATWTGNNVTSKNIHVGEKSRGSSGSPYKTLHGGVEIARIPTIVYKTDSEMMNCLRVIGKGEGKDQVSVWCEDSTSISNYGYIEGQPYRSNMISKESTATAIGDAIIAAKKDPITQLHVDPAYYINDLKYGDWIKIIDSYSGINTTKRIKKIVQSFNSKNGELMQIELGDQFNNYENIIADLTKGDVDAEKEMTLGGGSFRITPNTPASTYVRIEKGSWYGTDGVFYEFTFDTFRPFWGGEPPYNATTVDNYFKALIQIKDNAVSSSDIEYKTSLTSGAHTGYNQATAEGESISPDSGYTPLGEVILKCDNVSGTVYDVEATDEGGSYIWRDVRPIIGSSATGFGAGGLWQVDGTETQLITAQDLDLRNKGIYFDKGVSNTRIYPSGDNLIINPTSTVSSIGLGGILSADYGIVNCDGITMNDSGSTLDMNYASIIDSGDIELYDSTSISPRLCFKTPLAEGHSGGYFESHNAYLDLIRYSDSTDVMTWHFDTKKIDVWGQLDMNASNIEMALGDIKNLDTIDAGYATGITIEDSTGSTKLILAKSSATSYAAQLSDDLDMNGNDIIKCKDIKGQTTGTDGANRLNLDFRGDANHRIYYTGASDNRLAYKTVSSHAFAIGANVITSVDTNGLIMNTGKYIKSASGDLELRAPSGSKIKFVIG